MPDLVVQPAVRPLVGSVPVPGDKSITHRALLVGAVARGRSRIVGAGSGEDNRATLAAMRAMGVRVEDGDDGDILVDGVGLDGLRAPSQDLDCGNSGTSMRLLAGILVAQRFASRL